MDSASRSSWKTKPLPLAREALALELMFTDAEAEQITRGFIPKEMENKWFIFFEQGWLYFHRSWTGACIYALRLDGSPAGVRVAESWVNRDPIEYTQTDVAADRVFVSELIRSKLLNRNDS